MVLRLPPSREVCRARKGGCGVLKWVWPLSREAVRADGLLRLAPGRVATVVRGRYYSTVPTESVKWGRGHRRLLEKRRRNSEMST